MKIVKVIAVLAVTASACAAQTNSSAFGANFRRFVQVQTAISTEARQASAAVQQKVDAVPTLPVQPADTKQQNAPEGERNALVSQLDAYHGQWLTQQSRFSFWAVFSIVAAALLALVGGIVSFFKKSTAAGIISLVVTAVVTVSNAYPLGALSDFYRGLASKAAALQFECKIDDPLTMDAFNSIGTQLKVLILTEGEKRPSLGKYSPPDEETAQQLAEVRVAAGNIEKNRVQ